MSFKMTKYNLHIEMQIEFNAFFKDYHKKVMWSIENRNVVLNDILAAIRKIYERSKNLLYDFLEHI